MGATVRRFGVLVPPANVTVEDELPRYLPEGVRFHVSRLHRQSLDLTYETLSEMVESTESAAVRVAQVDPEVIVWACTSGSFIEGHGKDRELAAKIESCTGIPATTTSTAVVEALEALDARRVFLITPYVQELNDREEQFLRDNGFEVTHTASFFHSTTVAIRETPSEEVAALALNNRAQAGTFDTVFISCTQLHSFDQIIDLESTLEVPVITSNQATLWAALRHMRVETRGLGGGRLFELTAALAA